MNNNHPNRRKKSVLVDSPTPAQIKEARLSFKLSQDLAAFIIYHPMKTWQNWEYGRRPMHPALFELFLIKGKEMLDNAVNGGIIKGST